MAYSRLVSLSAQYSRRTGNGVTFEHQLHDAVSHVNCLQASRADPTSTISMTRSARRCAARLLGGMRLAVANRVSIKRLIWPMPIPKSRGIIKRATFLIAGCENEIPKLNFIPFRTREGI